MARRKKSRSEPFAIIPRRTIQSKELNNLSIHARWLYVVMTSKWSRSEPTKEITFSYTELRKITGFRYEMISKAFKELELAGFIKIQRGRLCYTYNRFNMSEHWLFIHDKDAPILSTGDDGINI